MVRIVLISVIVFNIYKSVLSINTVKQLKITTLNQSKLLIMKALKVLVIILLATFSFQAASAQVRHHHKKYHKVVRRHHRIVKHR